MGELTKIGDRFGTDKASFHGYTEIYQELFEPFRHEMIDVFEIGVLRYASLLMWQAYFTRARIIGIDIELREPIPEFNAGSSMVELIECDATHPRLLNELPRLCRPRIVIDDGSHASADHILTLHLLYPLLEPGGIYIIEDTHCQHKHMQYRWGWLNDGINSLQWLRSQREIPQELISYHSSLKFQDFSPSVVIIKKP